MYAPRLGGIHMWCLLTVPNFGVEESGGKYGFIERLGHDPLERYDGAPSIVPQLRALSTLCSPTTLLHKYWRGGQRSAPCCLLNGCHPVICSGILIVAWEPDLKKQSEFTFSWPCEGYHVRKCRGKRVFMWLHLRQCEAGHNAM